MASLVIVRRGADIVGQCDVGCYDARHPECVCSACGGVNHGVGLEQAIANTRRLYAEWLERARAAHPDIDFELDTSVQHLPLFDLPKEKPCL